jgi:hypothetical protein
VEHAIKPIKEGQRIRVNGTEGYGEILSNREALLFLPFE